VQSSAQQRLQPPRDAALGRNLDALHRDDGRRRHPARSRPATVECFEQTQAQRELIARRARAATIELLGGHVRGRADQAIRHRLECGWSFREIEVGFGADVLMRACARETEVHQPHATVLLDHDVFRLDVPMNESLRVSGGQSSRRLLEHVDELVHVALGGASPLADPVAERLPLDVLHRDVHLVFVIADLEDRHHVRVTQPSERDGFPAQMNGGQVRARVAQHLDRDHPVERRVPRREHQPHAAAADLAQHVVLRDPRGLDPGEHLTAQARQSHVRVERVTACARGVFFFGWHRRPD